MRFHFTALIVGLLLARGVLAQGPGTDPILLQVTDPASAIWDVSQVGLLTDVSMNLENSSGTLDIGYGVDFVQDGKGKLTGAGTTQPVVSYDFTGGAGDVPSFPASYTVKGTLATSRGSVRLLYQSSISGIVADRKVTAFAKYTLTLNAATHQYSGTFTRAGAAQGLGKISNKGNIGATDLPGELGDGSWTLQLNLQPVVDSKLTGTATVTLAVGTAGTTAPFNFPIGVAIDAAGNMYVADTGNHTIRKVSATGIVTTLAGRARDVDGDGVSDGDFAEGTGAHARFADPSGVAVDAAGNVYVAEAGNNLIRKISPTGATAILAGNGFSGNVDGSNSVAQFSTPTGVAVDGAGNVYVTDSDNNAIRRVTPTGDVTTLADAADGLQNPNGVALDHDGNLFIANTGKHTILKISDSGEVETFAGQAGAAGAIDGAADVARFNGPFGVAVDTNGTVYVADTDNTTIRKISPAGDVTTWAGRAGVFGDADGTNTNALFRHPSGVAVDTAGNLLVSDTDNGTIRKITPVGVVTTVTNGAAPQVYSFAITGTFKAATQQSKLTLKGLGAATGSSVKVLLTGNQITSVAGKVCGQTVKISP